MHSVRETAQNNSQTDNGTVNVGVAHSKFRAARTGTPLSVPLVSACVHGYSGPEGRCRDASGAVRSATASRRIPRHRTRSAGLARAVVRSRLGLLAVQKQLRLTPAISVKNQPQQSSRRSSVAVDIWPRRRRLCDALSVTNAKSASEQTQKTAVCIYTADAAAAGRNFLAALGKHDSSVAQYRLCLTTKSLTMPSLVSDTISSVWLC